MRCRSLLLLLVFVLSGYVADASVTFGGKYSTVDLKANTTLFIDTQLQVNGGSINKRLNSSVLGEDIKFIEGYLITDDNELFLTGDTRLDSNNNVVLNGDDEFNASGGTVLHSIRVSGKNNKIEGSPNLTGDDGIVMLNHLSTATIAVESTLKKNIQLRGSTVYLGENLTFADDTRFTNSGTVDFKGYRLILGGKGLYWNDEMRWLNATDITFNGSVDLQSTSWIFDGDANINGNGYELDLTRGGTIRIKAGSTVQISNLKIKGLGMSRTSTGGRGHIQFDANNASMRMTDSELELATTYGVTVGGIYVASASSLVTKDNVLRFSAVSTLTIDGCAVTYETLQFGDFSNVETDRNRFVGHDDSGLIKLNGGEMRYLRTIPSSYVYDKNTTLGQPVLLTQNKRMSITQDAVITGSGYFIYFGKASTPLLTVSAGKTATFKDVLLRNVRPSLIRLGAGASVIFAGATHVELGDNDSLTSQWTFTGASVLDGQGFRLTFDGGSIVVTGSGDDSSAGGAALAIDNVTLYDVSDSNPIRCQDVTHTLTLRDVTIHQGGALAWNLGRLEIIGETSMAGQQKFTYRSTSSCFIKDAATWMFDRNMTFSYDPTIQSENLIDMSDPDGILFLNGADLYTTHTGLSLTKGTLMIDNKVDVYNVGATALSQSVRFGNGTSADDLNVHINPGGSLNLQSGVIHYLNAES